MTITTWSMILNFHTGHRFSAVRWTTETESIYQWCTCHLIWISDFDVDFDVDTYLLHGSPQPPWKCIPIPFPTHRHGAPLRLLTSTVWELLNSWQRKFLFRARQERCLDCWAWHLEVTQLHAFMNRRATEMFFRVPLIGWRANLFTVVLPSNIPFFPNLYFWPDQLIKISCLIKNLDQTYKLSKS